MSKYDGTKTKKGCYTQSTITKEATPNCNAYSCSGCTVSYDSTQKKCKIEKEEKKDSNYASSYYTCPSGKELIGNHCYYEVSGVKKSADCNFDWINGHCYRNETSATYHAGSYYCDSGWDLVDNKKSCVRTKTTYQALKSSDYTCPSGYEKVNNTSSCIPVPVYNGAPSYTCDYGNGWTLDSTGTKCTSSPNYNCGNGYTLISVLPSGKGSCKSNSSSGNARNFNPEYDSVEYIYSCQKYPSYQKADDKCVFNGCSDSVNEHIITKNGKKVCERVLSYTPKEAYTCDRHPGYELEGNKCVKKTDAKQGCNSYNGKSGTPANGACLYTFKIGSGFSIDDAFNLTNSDNECKWD